MKKGGQLPVFSELRREEIKMPSFNSHEGGMVLLAILCQKLSLYFYMVFVSSCFGYRLLRE